jgi:hypothetical protein
MRTLPNLHPPKARCNDIISVACAGRFRQEEVRVAGATPCVDCIEIKVTCVRISLGEAACVQIGQYLIELLQIKPKTACGLWGRNIAGLNAKAHQSLSLNAHFGSLS